MSQLDSSDDSTPFSAFKISYSVDGLAYAELPEVRKNKFNFVRIILTII